MNKSYQIVWSKVLQQWVVTSELSKSCGTGSSVKGVASKVSAFHFYFLPIALGLFLNGWHAAFASPPIPSQLPVGGQVVAGQADISQTSNVLNVNQSSQRAVIEWQSFNLGKNAQVNFNQPSTDSVTLNRVLDNNPSQIFGKISSPGQVFLLNPNGAYFAPSASLEVGSFLASTHKISTEDFMAGRSTLVRDGATGRILNEGQIKASLGGYIALLAPEVRNNGLLIAELGRVVMAAGEAYTLKFEGAGLLSNVVVSPSTINSYVENGNAVIAPGGLIILSAQVANRMLSGVVENTGSLQANAMVNDGGRILLRSTDKINNSGSIQANASINNTGKGGNVTLIADLDNPNSQTIVSGNISAKGGGLGGDGGFIETSASNLNIQNGANISATAPLGNAGVWLLDPVNITIQSGGTTPVSSAGGTVSPADSPSTVDVATLNAALTAGNSVTITTTAGGLGSQEGDITIDAPISKTGGSTGSLTLNADRNIIINSSITASGTGVTLPVTLKATGGYIEGTTNGTINTNGGTLTLNSGAGSGNIQGIISGAGGITKEGAGTLIFSGNNTYTGNTTVNAGVLKAGVASIYELDGLTLRSSSVGKKSNLIVPRAGASFELNGFNTEIGELRLSGTTSELKLSGGATLTLNTVTQALDSEMSRINGKISGDGHINIKGNGKLILISRNTSTYSGTTTIGALATFQLGNGEDTNLTPYSGSGEIINNGNLTIFDLRKDQTYNNLISGSGKLNINLNTLDNTNTVTLTANNTYLGTTTITTGSLQIGNGSSTGTLGSGNVVNNSSLIFNRNIDTTIGNSISGTGSLSINANSRTISLTGNNSYGGTTTINSGTLQIGNGFSTGTLGSGNVVNNSILTFNRNVDTTIANSISGTGSLNIYAFDKTITLTGTNSYAGITTINSGTLQIGNGSSTGTLGSGNVVNHSSLIFNRNVDTAINNTISGTGSIIANINGSLTINNGFTLSSSANDIILSARDNFINNAGSTALTVTGANKRWVIYSADPSTNTFGGLNSGNKALWGSTYSSLPPASVGTGNRYVFSSAGGTVSASTTAASKFYGDDPVTLSPVYSYLGNAFSSGNTFGVYSNSDFSDALTVIPSVTSAGNSVFANVGSTYSYTITNGTAKSGFSYSLASNSAFFTVDKATVTLSNITKTYDRTTGLGNTTLTISGVRGETLNFSDATYFDANVGTNNNHLTSLTLEDGSSGALKSNYQLPTLNATNALATITKKALTLSGLNVANKVYDKTSNATIVNLGSLVSGAQGAGDGKIYSGDAVVLSSTNALATFGNPDVGANKTVTVSGLSLSNGNYSIADLATTATITQKPVTLSGLTVANKVYDKSTNATIVNLGSLASGSQGEGDGKVYSGDTVQVVSTNASASFADANVGQGKTVTVSGLRLSNGNYSIADHTSTATITQKAVTLSGLTIANKVYDKSTHAIIVNPGSLVSGAQVEGDGKIYSGDTVEVIRTNASASFADPNAGQGKTVTVSGLSLSNSNYRIANQTASADITAQTLNLTGSRTYNGTTVLTYHDFNLSGAVSGETVTLTAGSATTLSPNVGSYGLRPASGLAISVTGGLASNYTLPTEINLSINKAPLTIRAISQTREYNGDTTSSALPTYGTLYGSDSLSGLSQSYASKNVLGENQSVLNVNNGYVLNDGNGGQNYLVTLVPAAGTITKAPLTISATSQTREYNADTSSSAMPTYGTLYGSDSLSGLSQSYASKHVLGENQSTLNVNIGYTLNDGNGGQNYTVTLATAAGTITKANLYINEVSVSNKVYDGEKTALLKGGVIKTINNDEVTLKTENATGLFESKDVGESKVVLATGYTITGFDRNNYNLIQPLGLYADISPKPLLVRANNDARIYDSTAYLGGNGVTLNGLVANESFWDLKGSLNYIGSSQGATSSGTYSIIPVGLTSKNYKIEYGFGELKIINNPPAMISKNRSIFNNFEHHFYDRNILKIYENLISNNSINNVIANLEFLSKPNSDNKGIAILDINRDSVRDGKLIYLKMPDQLFDFKTIEIDSKYLTEWFDFAISKKKFKLSSVPLDIDFIIVPIKIDGENWNFQFNFKK